MTQTKSIFQEKISNNHHLFINLVFAFFPISFIIGSLIVNLNLLLFCCLGIFYLRSKILSYKYDFFIKIIFLFFLLVFFSTSLSVAKTIYFEGYNNVDLDRLTKSILFFRFFLFLIIVYLLSKFNILNFKHFFLTAALSSILVSSDIIYQHIFGHNIIGLKSAEWRNSGFFGDELVAGGYIERFSFFSILFTIFVFKNKNYVKFISTVIVICVLGIGIFLSGNRMPFILFLFGIFVILLFNLKIKKILFVSLVSLSILLKFIISSSESHKYYITNSYYSFYDNFIDLVTLRSQFGIPQWIDKDIKKLGEDRDKNYVELLKVEQKKKEESFGPKVYYYNEHNNNHHKRVFATAIYTWRANKIFGNGIKSFREDCQKLKRPDISVAEDIFRTCSNHPHNYYFEILTETGIVGLFIASTIALMFVVFIFKNLRFAKQISIESLILLSAIISLILETLPLRSTGSLFTTNNATYLILISSIVLSHKVLMKINTPR